jgi:type IV pilus assembly protein PilY1
MNNQSPTGKPKWRKYSVNTSGVIDTDLDFSNGLSTPRPVDVDGDGNVDLIYAGDIKGNLWRFDVRNLNAVTVNKIFKTLDKQPIYTAPVVTKLPAASKQLCPEGKLNECWMVSFGTGELYNSLSSTNIKNIVTQAFYGIYDIGDTGTGALVLDSQLVPQTISTLTTFTGASSRSISNNPVAYGPTKTGVRGWKLTLSAAEHTSANPILMNGRVIFASARPTGAPNAACAPGDGWLTVMDIAQGSSNDSSSIGVPLTGNIEIISQASRTSDINTIFLPSALAPLPANTMTKYCPPGTSCTPDKKNLIMPTISGRMSWREVFGLPK